MNISAPVSGPAQRLAPEFPGLAVPAGFQPAPADFTPAPGGFWLYNLTRSIPGHPAGSTVAERTLRHYLANLSPIYK